MISICTCNRNDGYESGRLGPIERFYLSLQNNCKYLLNTNLEYEYIVVNWNPDHKLLYNNSLLKELFDKYPIKEIVVNEKAIVQNDMNPNVFQEYYAKNISVRNAIYDNLLITNHDILLPETTCLEIKTLIDIGLGKNFYRNRYRNEYDIYQNNLIHDDGFLCAGYSGDFLLIKKDLFCGYDETNILHREGRQNSMDGEILWKLHLDGLGIKMLQNGYKHINHSKTNIYHSKDYNKKGYINPSNWGFSDFPKKSIAPNCIVIYGKQ